ncbi:MAG: ABC transporter ATP-binding protein [Proteobacteria bacterium]|nr:ABC transporter ATP-binding protein [Pseudomonadota bacterium]
MSPALRISGVTKAYGKIQALRGLDSEIARGVVGGLVGPIGAGKTTTFGIVGGVLGQDSGEVSLLGAGPFDAAVHRGRVTLLPQDCELNPHTSVRDLLVFYARLQGAGRTEARQDADRCLELVDLSDRAGMRIKQLSHGMRRRVAVAQAFLGSPELVLLDEPTSGLDPAQVIRLRDLFREQRGKRTLIISSHVLSELEATCDYVVMMEQGRCVLSGTMEEITKVGERVEFVLAGNAPIEAIQRAVPEAVLAVSDDGLVVTGQPGTPVHELNAKVLRVLLDAGVGVQEIRRGQSLEQRWLDAREG